MGAQGLRRVAAGSLRRSYRAFRRGIGFAPAVRAAVALGAGLASEGLVGLTAGLPSRLGPAQLDHRQSQGRSSYKPHGSRSSPVRSYFGCRRSCEWPRRTCIVCSIARSPPPAFQDRPALPAAAGRQVEVAALNLPSPPRRRPAAAGGASTAQRTRHLQLAPQPSGDRLLLPLPLHARGLLQVSVAVLNSATCMIAAASETAGLIPTAPPRRRWHALTSLPLHCVAPAQAALHLRPDRVGSAPHQTSPLGPSEGTGRVFKH